MPTRPLDPYGITCSRTGLRLNPASQCQNTPYLDYKSTFRTNSIVWGSSAVTVCGTRLPVPSAAQLLWTVSPVIQSTLTDRTRRRHTVIITNDTDKNTYKWNVCLAPLNCWLLQLIAAQLGILAINKIHVSINTQTTAIRVATWPLFDPAQQAADQWWSTPAARYFCGLSKSVIS